MCVKCSTWPPPVGNMEPAVLVPCGYFSCAVSMLRFLCLPRRAPTISASARCLRACALVVRDVMRVLHLCIPRITTEGIPALGARILIDELFHVPDATPMTGSCLFIRHCDFWSPPWES